jgi:hypothetical protein
MRRIIAEDNRLTRAILLNCRLSEPIPVYKTFSLQDWCSSIQEHLELVVTLLTTAELCCRVLLLQSQGMPTTKIHRVVELY